jgi:transposase
MARPPKYNPDRHQRAVDALRAGNTRRAAAWAAGIEQNTILDWIRRYPDFADAVKAAEADAELAMVQRVRTAADESWQAAAWWLERKMKQDWSARQEQTGADGGAVRVVVEYAEELTPADE